VTRKQYDTRRMRTLAAWPFTSQAGLLTSEPQGQTAQQATKATNKP